MLLFHKSLKLQCLYKAKSITKEKNNTSNIRKILSFHFYSTRKCNVQFAAGIEN